MQVIFNRLALTSWNRHGFRQVSPIAVILVVPLNGIAEMHPETFFGVCPPSRRSRTRWPVRFGMIGGKLLRNGVNLASVYTVGLTVHRFLCDVQNGEPGRLLCQPVIARAVLFHI